MNRPISIKKAQKQHVYSIRSFLGLKHLTSWALIFHVVAYCVFFLVWSSRLPSFFACATERHFDLALSRTSVTKPICAVLVFRFSDWSKYLAEVQRAVMYSDADCMRPEMSLMRRLNSGSDYAYMISAPALFLSLIRSVVQSTSQHPQDSPQSLGLFFTSIVFTTH